MYGLITDFDTLHRIKCVAINDRLETGILATSLVLVLAKFCYRLIKL